MSSRRVHPAAVAAASDGSVLLNVALLLPEALQQQIERRLGGPVFVGVALSQHDASAVVTRLDDAAAEAAAHLLGGDRSPASPQKRRKSRSAGAAQGRGKQTAKRAGTVRKSPPKRR
jgi:hypothetical protein